MQIETQELEPFKFKVNYEADFEQIMNKRGEVLNTFRKAPVPGNRNGKASIEAIQVYYRKQIEESLKRALVEDAYHNTLFEKKMRPLGAPKFNFASLMNNKFSCEFEVCTKPDFTLASFKGLEIAKPTLSMSEDEMTEQLLQELRFKYGEISPYTESDVVEKGDNIILDYEGFIDNQKIEALSITNEMLTVGKSQIPEIDEHLVGMKISETKEFDLSVPKEGLPSIAGKMVHFKATLKTGSKTVPSPLDDTLAERMGKSTFAELRDSVKVMATNKLQQEFKSKVHSIITNILVSSNEFMVPPWLSLSEAQYLAHQAKHDWSTTSDEDKERFLQLAEKNVKLSLILDKIREDELEAQISDQEIFNMIKQNLMKSKTQASIDEVIEEMNRTGYLQILFSRIREEYVLDYIYKLAKIGE